MILPGIVSATFREKTADEILQVSRACGLKAIEWSEHAHVFPGDQVGADYLYRKTIASGLQVAAYGSYFRLLEKEHQCDRASESVLFVAANSGTFHEGTLRRLHELAARKKLLNIHTYYWKGDIRRPFSEGISEWSQYLAQIDINEERYALMEFVMDSTFEH